MTTIPVSEAEQIELEKLISDELDQYENSRISIKALKEHEDGSMSMILDMDEEMLIKLAQIGLHFIVRQEADSFLEKLENGHFDAEGPNNP